MAAFTAFVAKWRICAVIIASAQLHLYGSINTVFLCLPEVPFIVDNMKMQCVRIVLHTGPELPSRFAPVRTAAAAAVCRASI